MRAVFVTLFLVVLSTSFAVKLGNQQKSLDLSNFKIESNDFLGDAIKGLLQVTLLPETQEVYDIITEVRQELQSLLVDTENNYKRELEAYTKSRDTYEKTIKELDSSIITTDAELSAAQKTKSELEEGITTSTNNLNAAQNAYNAETERREQAVATHAAKVADLTEAIAACEEALRLMGEVRAKDLPARNAVFLQTSEQKIKGHIQKISEKLQKMSLKGTIAPFLKALVEMTQEGVNWELIDKIIALIKDLQASLRQEIENANQEDANDAKYSEGLLETLHNTISAERVSIEQKTELLTGVEENIKSLLAALRGFQDAFDLNTQALEGLNADWERKSGNYNDAMERLRKDIAVLGQALEYLDAQH